MSAIPARAIQFFRRDRFPFPRVVIGVISLLSLPLLLLYTNNRDSVDYHLPRVYHWLQHGNLDPFVTGDVRQVYISSLASQLASISIGLSGSALFVNLIQFLAYLGCCVGLYRSGTLLFGDRLAGRWAAFFFATVPAVVLQATSPQTDLVAAVFVVFAVERYLTFVRGARQPPAEGIVGNPVSELVVAGALGVAAKATTGPILAVLCLLAAVFVVRHLTYRMAGAVLGGGLVASAILLPPFYRLWRLFPDLHLPHNDRLFVGSFELVAGIVNYLRYSMQSLVCLQVVGPGLPIRIQRMVDRWSTAVGATPEELSAWTFKGSGYAPENHLFHHSLSYDPKVYVALLLVVVVVPWGIFAARGQWNRARVLDILLVVLCGWAAFFVLFAWQHWGGRLQIPYVAGLSVLVGGVLALRGRLVAIAAGAVFLFSLSLGLMASVLNESKSMVAWTGYNGRRVVAWWDRPYAEAFIANRRRADDYERVVEVLRELPAQRIGLKGAGSGEFLLWKTLVEAHGVFGLPEVYHLRQDPRLPSGVAQGRLQPDDLDTLDYIVVFVRRPRPGRKLPPGWHRHPATSANELVFVLVRQSS